MRPTGIHSLKKIQGAVQLLSFAVPAVALTVSVETQALDQIIRPYQSVRSAGMGGVRMTTGLYDENFFNNPARVTANPESKVTLFQLTPIETTPASLNVATTLMSGADFNSTATSVFGSNIHQRMQLILPAYYLAAHERPWALAIGVITGVQADLNLRKSYQTTDSLIADVGAAVTFGYKLLPEDALSIGITGHLSYRAGASPNFSLLDYIRGSSLTLSSVGGEGAMINFDLGATYKVTQWGEFDVNVAGAIQNLLGGGYGTIPLKIFNISSLPPPQNSSFGLGGSLYRATWGNFHDTYFALEATDFMNNSNGSLFKLLHLGGETHWKGIALRLGLNQGYWAAGLGLDASFFTLDLASYGEEMGLNAGTLEDRRYTLNLGFHI